MKKVPLLSVWMERLYCLFLNRTDIKEGLKTILTGIEQIKNGISMCIFPEGTRNKGDDETKLLPFKEGSFKMAEKTGCPIILMSMNNTSAILEEHFPFIRSTHVVLEYSKPIYPKELSKEERKFLGAYCEKQLAENGDTQSETALIRAHLYCQTFKYTVGKSALFTGKNPVIKNEPEKLVFLFRGKGGFYEKHKKISL